MRILANENFPGDAVDALRQRGHDVVWVRTDAPGSKDTEFLLAHNAKNASLSLLKDLASWPFALANRLCAELSCSESRRRRQRMWHKWR